MKKTFSRVLILCAMITSRAHGISVVYNLRIAQSTRPSATQRHYTKPTTIALTEFNQFHKLYSGRKQHVNGLLGSMIYDPSPSPFSIRIDWAGAQTRADALEARNPRIITTMQADDILFTSGYSHKIGERTKVSLLGLLGLPVHKDTSFDPSVQFGTGHVGIGGQLDGSYIYSENKKHALMGASRLIYFFPRDIHTKLVNRDLNFEFALGYLADLLIAHYSGWGKHRFEFGYNPTFAFGASTDPVLPEKIPSTLFIKSSFYSAYQYAFYISDYPSAIITGLSYGFDHVPKTVERKYSVTLWLTWGINF